MSSLHSAGTALVWHSPDCLNQIVMTLADRGYQVYSSSKQEEILELVLRTLPDVLLIDLQVSGKAGYELCKTL